MSDLAAGVKTEASGFSRRLRILGILLVSIAAVAASGLFSVTLYTPDGMSINGLITHLLLPTANVLIMLLIVLMAKRTEAVGKLDLAWLRRSRSETAAVLLLPVVALVLIVSVTALLNVLGWKWQTGRAFSADGRRIVFFVALTVYLAVAEPVLSEVFWRGYVQRALERVTGPFPAAVGQAVLFTSVHVRPLGGLAPVFILGLVTGIWRWRRRTLVPVIAVHVVLNGLLCAAHWPNWLDCAKVRFATDYLSEMTGVVRPAGYDPNADARDCYEQAFETVVPMPQMLGVFRRGLPRDWSEEAFSQFRMWVAANETALKHVAEGTRRPYYCPVYRGPTAMLAGMPEAAGIREVAFVLDARIKLRAFDGEDEQFLSDVATLYRFACHLSGAKILSHQLVGLSIRTLLTGTLRGVLAYEPLPPRTLAALQRQFEQLGDADRLTLDFTLERLVWLDGIQRVFTDDGNGHGRVPRAVITGLEWMPGPFKMLTEPISPGQNAAFLGLSRQETSRCAEEFLSQIGVAAGSMPWNLYNEPDGVNNVLNGLVGQNAYVRLLGTACLGVLEMPWRAGTELDALTTTIAAIRYEAEKGEYPDSLSRLVETGFLRRVPRDPYSDGPLTYKHGGAGFLLYSHGRDFDDDGGFPSQWGQGSEGGDQLFWPVR